MPRFHNFEGKLVQFTDAEETARDAEEKAWSDAAATRAWQALRIERDNKIAKSDWRANSDVTMSDAWKTYRQALRDITKDLKTSTQVKNVTWPTEPS